MEKQRKLEMMGYWLAAIAVAIIMLLMWAISMYIHRDVAISEDSLSTNKSKPDTCLVYKKDRNVYIRKIK